MAPQKPNAKSTTKISSRKSATNPIKARKEKVTTSCKQIFKGLTFSFSGNFGVDWEYDKMASWIRHHGGTYESVVSADTTHLICTIDDYKKKTQQVRKAWALGRFCCIVTSDWLDDCLIGGKVKRCRVETGYTLDRTLKRLHQSKGDQQKYRDSFERGVKAGNELAGKDLYHVYYDGTAFEYKIVCQRFPEAGSTKCEKYTIYLFESHAKPSLYMVGAKYSKGAGHKASYWREKCYAQVWKDAWKAFKGFFYHTTGIDWDDRCDGLPPVEGKFRYMTPTLGRPVGALPEGKNAPDFAKEVEIETGAETETVVETETETETEEDDGGVVPEGLVYDTDSEGESDDTESTKASSSNPSFAVQAPIPTTPTSISSDSGCA